MSQLEIKGALAKLLATENLIVQHDGAAQTASFNTATRVLTLPILKIENSHVYDMFIGHEVGHALYTPENWRDVIPENVPFDFVNVVEDVRIEKLIQDKFPGLRTDFSHGYRKLNDEDFFEIIDKDLTKLNFIDRVNLHFKLGALAVIPFTAEEMVYVNLVEDANTFDKVCFASKMIAQFVKASREKEEASQSEDEIQEGMATFEAPGDSNPDGDEVKPSNDTSEDEGEDDENPIESPSLGSEGGDESSETQRAFDKNLERQMDKSGSAVTYIETPDEELKIYPLEFLRESFKEAILECNFDLSRITEEYKQFISSIKKDVNFMVQQFEMKKSANAYARTRVNKTGVLDTELLHQYKISEDIFLRQEITPDGKNHGVVMLVDWSGSMSDHIVPTVKQLLVLIQFCRKVNIPFDVYTFTCQGYGHRMNEEAMSPHKVSLSFNSQVVHILSSSAKRREIDDDMFHLYNQAKKISYTFSPAVWVGELAMGGTPLNNVLFAVPNIIENFKRRTGAQKVSFVCLTDGESSPIHYNQPTDYGLRIAMTNGYHKVFLRDGRNTYQLDSHNETASIINWLNHKMNDVTITNIFLAGPKGFEKYHRHLMNTSVVDNTQYKKQGAQSFSMKNGWPLVCVVNPNTFRDSQQEIQVEDGASKAQVKSALRKFLKTKSVSKLILSQLVEQFA